MLILNCFIEEVFELGDGPLSEHLQSKVSIFFYIEFIIPNIIFFSFFFLLLIELENA